MQIEITPRPATELLNIIAQNGNIMSDECREFKEKLEEINNAKNKNTKFNKIHII